MYYLQKDLQEKLGTNPEIFEFVQETALNGLWYRDVENPDEEWISDAFWKELGYEPANKPSKSSAWQEVIFPDDLRLVLDHSHLHCQDISHPYDLELRFKHQNGDTVWMKTQGMAIRDDQGNALRMMATFCNITRLKKLELQLNDRVDLMDQANNMARIVTWRLNPENNIIRLGKTASDILNLRDEYDYQLSDFLQIFIPEDSQRLEKLFKKLISSESSVNDDFELNLNQRKTLFVRIIGSSANVPNKGFRVHGVIQDIDQKVRMMKNLSLQEQLFRKTFECASIGIALVGLDGSWMKVNDSVCEMVGYSREELLKLTFQDITHPEDLDKDLSLLQETLDGKRNSYVMEKRYFHKNGNLVWALLSVVLVKDADDNPAHFISQITDISKTKRNEIALSKSHGRLNSIFLNNSQVAMIEIDLKGKIVSFNDGAEDLLGYPKRIAKGMELFKLILADDLDNFLSAMQISGNEIRYQDIISGIEKAGMIRGEWRFKHENGQIIPAQMTLTGMRDSNDDINQLLAVLTDTSKMHEAQVEVENLLNLTTAQNDRLRNLTHIVSHNLRSQTGKFRMLLDLLEVKHKNIASDDVFPALLRAADELNGTVSRLNDVINVQSTQGETIISVDLYNVVYDLLPNLKALFDNSDVQVSVDIPKGTLVRGVPAYMESVLTNLITNAVKYKSNSRESFIQLSAVNHSNQVQLTVQDNGLGMDLDKVGDRLFKLYETFHQHSDARGVGLFLVKNQVESMGGRIEVTSEVDVGTTFTIWFMSGG